MGDGGGLVERAVRVAGAVCCWLVGLVLATGAVGLAAEVPASLRVERAYASAEPCPPHVRGGADSDCLYEIHAEVTGTVVKGGRYSEYTLGLKGREPLPEKVSLGDDEPLLGGLDPGDSVTVTLWRDYPTAVSRGGVTQVSAETPDGEADFTTGFALFVAVAAAYLFFAGCVLVRARRGGGHALVEGLVHASVAVGCVIVAGFVGAAAAGLVGPDRPGPWAVLAAWGLLTPPALAVTRALRRRRATARRRAAPRTDGLG
ncbi:hypothetical protein [Streptomyces sp. NPDC050504]|uniref:hypothetical protein n=1 Tax=Streptomyces sp. NPDC050504 TaxID=3365618 RepID=UPI0037B79ADF